MANESIETLFVNIEGDFSGLLSAAEKGVDKTKDKLEELEKAGKQSGEGGVKGAAKMGAAFGLAAGAAGKLLDVVVKLAVAIPQMFAALAQGAIAANAQFETFGVQFETLLGSSGAAKERLEELARFGVETPFELPEVVQANIQLQTFGGNALASAENLKLLGDAAAANNAPFSETATWFGRLYSQLQGGKPFGEAAARLQELAILAPEVRTEMEAMQKQGKSGAEIWSFFSEQVGGKFGGAMDKLSKTFQGVTSNIKDFQGQLLREGGEEFFNEIRQSAVDFYAFLSANEETFIEIAKTIGDFGADIVKAAREWISSFDVAPAIEGVKSFLDWLNRVKTTTAAAVGQLMAFGKSVEPVFQAALNFLKIIASPILGPFLNQLSAARELFTRLDEAMITAAKGLAIITATIQGLKVTADGAWVSLKGMGNIVLAIATQDIDALKSALTQVNTGILEVTEGGAAAFKASMLESAAAIDAMINPIEEATDAVETFGGEMAETAEEATLALGPIAEKFTNQLIDATENRAKEQERLEKDHGEKMADIISDANEKALDIDKKYTDALADLTTDTEKKRLDIIEGTRRDLAKLADQTDRNLSERRKTFNKDEARETEDHLKEMRRLQEDHLLDLEDAVRSRDAGTIVDLQRRFQQESSRKEEDFSQGQSRDKADFGDELNQIRENEALRREELLTKQAEQLDDLRLHEEEKRLELETRRAEENEKLQMNLQERLQKENDNYIERQAALDEALQKQLEAIAKSLADEKEVTEEGAREILETFDEYFGIGGNIDQLMADFSRRRKIKADITVAFNETTSAEPTPSESLASGGSFGGRKRLGGVQEFAEGGTLIATKPTLAMFGEAGPEVVQFTPMSQLSSPDNNDPGRMIIEMTGSAPPGVGKGEVDQIAGVLLQALHDSGALN